MSSSDKIATPAYPPFWSKAEEYVHTDFSSKQGADILCERIMAAWCKAGHYDVRAWPVTVAVKSKKNRNGTDFRVDVRTNLIAGWPPSVWHNIQASGGELPRAGVIEKFF